MTQQATLQSRYIAVTVTICLVYIYPLWACEYDQGLFFCLPPPSTQDFPQGMCRVSCSALTAHPPSQQVMSPGYTPPSCCAPSGSIGVCGSTIPLWQFRSDHAFTWTAVHCNCARPRCCKLQESHAHHLLRPCWLPSLALQVANSYALHALRNL